MDPWHLRVDLRSVHADSWLHGMFEWPRGVLMPKPWRAREASLHVYMKMQIVCVEQWQVRASFWINCISVWFLRHGCAALLRLILGEYRRRWNLVFSCVVCISLCLPCHALRQCWRAPHIYSTLALSSSCRSPHSRPDHVAADVDAIVCTDAFYQTPVLVEWDEVRWR